MSTEEKREKIVRSEGENETEKILSQICDNTFLRLWVYPNPYKKKADELCDVLVLFENHIFIFSVKDITFNTDKEIKVAWNRWKRRAIDASIKQLERAESWIKRYPDQIFLDPQCKKKLPININLEDCKFHRIIVAHGAEEACKNFSSDNVAGSLAIAYGDNFPSDGKGKFEFPFMIDLPREKVFHVFDSFNLDIILGELDTISDLVWYFEAKEESIQKYTALNYCGEEDLLAHYFYNFDRRRKKHFIGTQKRNIHMIHIGEGEWHDFVKTDAYHRKKEADQISYFWDKLLQKTLQNALDNTLLGDADVYNGQSAIIEMAKEPRFYRREISKAIWQSIENVPDFGGEMGRNLSSYPSYYPDKRYVFLQLTPMPDKDYDTEYRPLRQEMLKIACGVEKMKRRKSKKVIGIAIDAPKYAGKRNSEDFALLDCENWSDEDEAYYTEANEHLQFFETDKVQIRHERTYNFPPAKKSSPPKKRKTGRNEKCPRGSGKKYKYCHYRIDKGH
jgi:hypothetical protein